MLNVGIIGYRNHAGRLMKLVNESGMAMIKTVYHPDKKLDLPGATQNIEDLIQCDAIMIASPNDTHFSYLDFFSRDYSGYLFCEKPPVSTKREMDEISNDPSRTFFNFNYRFSRLKEAFSEAMENGALGNPIHMFASMTQGLAFKDSYPGSWRSDAARHRHGVTETKAIHYIDLASLFFGELADHSYVPSNVAKTGSAFDTSFINLYFKGGQAVTLLMSYAAPLTADVRILGANGVIEYRNNILKILSPRDTFDERGNFAPPPERILADYNQMQMDMYEESLEKSVMYFLRNCEEKSKFPEKLFQTSLDTNRLMLTLTADVA